MGGEGEEGPRVLDVPGEKGVEAGCVDRAVDGSVEGGLQRVRGEEVGELLDVRVEGLVEVVGLEMGGGRAGEGVRLRVGWCGEEGSHGCR